MKYNLAYFLTGIFPDLSGRSVSFVYAFNKNVSAEAFACTRLHINFINSSVHNYTNIKEKRKVLLYYTYHN